MYPPDFSNIGLLKFKCLHCPFSANTRYNLKRHLENHAGGKPLRPYKCSSCPKSYRNKSDLNVHLIHHTGEKSFHCTRCNKFFVRKCYLDLHIYRHKLQDQHWKY